MNKFKKILLAFTMMWAVMACDLDKLDNPNSVSPANSDVDYVLNQVQLSFAGLFFGMSDYGMQMTRLQHFYGPTYEAGFSAQSFDGFWSTAYSGVLINTKTLIPAAEANSQFVHAGIAQVIEAYTLMSLVDYFGDVPYSEALDANNFNPVADDGADVYAAQWSNWMRRWPTLQRPHLQILKMTSITPETRRVGLHLLKHLSSVL